MSRKMSAKTGSIIRGFNPLRSRKAALATATLAGVCAMQSAVALAVTENFEWVGTDGTNPTIWNLTSLNWNNITTLQNSVAWANNADPTTPNAAFFLPTPTPGTVTVNANVDLSTLGFGAGGWNIAAGTGDLSFGTNGGNLTITTVNDNTIGANIVDRTAATSISVGNAGVVTLTGTNTYSGGTSLNGGGTLAIDSLARVGSGTINFSGGWLRVDGTALTSIDGRMAAGEDTARFMINDVNNVFTMNTALAAGSGVLFAKGPGILVVSGQNLNTGATDLSTQAYLRIAGGDNRLNPAANMGIYEGSTLDLNGNNQEVAKLDSNDASVVVTNSAASTTSILTIGGVGSATYPGQLNDGAGTLALVKNGTATQTMTGTSTYSGGTTINGGILSISSDAALGAASGAVTLNSGTLQGITGISLDAARGVVLGAGGGTVHNLAHDSVMTINGVVSGASDLTKFAPATLPHGAVALTGNNTYDGATIINGNATQAGDDATTLRGGLIAASNNALGSTVGGTTINTNAWLGLQGSITTAESITLATSGQITGNIRSLSGDNTLSAVLNAGTNAANFGVHSGSLRVSSAINSGILSSANAVTKVGDGTLIFDSAQTYAGRTLVQLAGDGRGVNTPGGTLKLEGTGGATASSVRVGATGTLLVDSSGNTADPVARTGSLVLGNGGTVIVNGNGANPTTDSFGTLTLGIYGGGDAFVVVNPGDGQTSTLSFASLTRDGLQNGSGNGPVLNIKGPNFGQAAGADVAQATFTTAPGLSGNILKHVTITDTVSGRTRFATNGANGIRQLDNSEYNLGTPTGGGVMNNGNVQLTGGTTTITADASVSSLTLEGNGITVDGASNLRSGSSNGANALLSTGAGNVISTATLDFGSVSATAVDEAIIWVEGDLTVNSVIRNATGVTTAANLAVTKAGPGELILAGDNTFLSDAVGNRIFRIGNGTVTFSSTGVDDEGVADVSAKNLGATNNQISLFSNGGLRLPGALGTVFVPQAISISSAGLGTVDGETAFIQVDSGSTLKAQGILHRPANTAGGFTKRGGGDLLLVGGTAFNRSGTGKSYLAEGSLSLAGGSTADYGGLQVGGWLVTSPGTTINFDASARPTSTSTRLGQVVFAGTRLNLTGNNANATQDQIGTFILDAGGSEVAITAGTGQTTTLNMSNTAGSWQRRQGGTAVFSGAGLGTAAAGVAKVTASGGVASIGGVLPYALADTTVGGDGLAFAVYGSNGITAVTSNTASIAAGGNVRLNASDNTAGTVNSIHLDGTGISAGSGTLNVTSGGVLSTGGANIVDANLAFDGREGIIHAVSNLTVNGAVSSSVGLTKAGPGTLTLAGANNWSGPTYSNGGNLLLNNSLTSSSAVHAIKGKVQLAAGGDKVIHTGAVSAVAGGKIDLVDNKLITTSPAGTFVGSAYDGVSGLVDSARGSAGNAMWDGSSGITTSDTRAVNNGDLVSIGVAKVSEVRSVSDSQTTTFAGRTVLGSDTLAMVTWGGDANLDGKINIDDYGRIDGNVGQSGSVFGWSRGDFNYDGKINIDDYGIIDGNINRQGTPFSTGGGAGLEGVAAVPEPASLGLVALAGLGLTRRRRRRDI